MFRGILTRKNIYQKLLDICYKASSDGFSKRLILFRMRSFSIKVAKKSLENQKKTMELISKL